MLLKSRLRILSRLSRSKSLSVLGARISTEVMISCRKGGRECGACEVKSPFAVNGGAEMTIRTVVLWLLLPNAFMAAQAPTYEWRKDPVKSGGFVHMED